MSAILPRAGEDDNELDKYNELAAASESAMNNADGASLEDASVTNAKLAKPKFILPITLTYAALSTRATGDIIGGFEIPSLDGAVNSTVRYLGCSIMGRVVTPAAGCRLDVYEGAVQKQQCDINDATLTSPKIFGFGDATLANPVDTQSGREWTVRYVIPAGAPTYTDFTIVLFFSCELVGT